MKYHYFLEATLRIGSVAMATFEFKKICLKQEDFTWEMWSRVQSSLVLCMNSVNLVGSLLLLSIVLGKQRRRRQIVSAPWKACSLLGNVVWVDVGGGRHKGLTRVYNIVCDYMSVLAYS